MARRILQDKSSGQTLELVLWEPHQDANDAHGDWSCRFEVRWNSGKTLSALGNGVDSLQALLTALSGLRRTIRAQGSDLVWLGKPGALGLPIMISEDDPDLAALLEHLIEAEYCRQVLLAKRR